MIEIEFTTIQKEGEFRGKIFVLKVNNKIALIIYLRT